MIERIDRPVQHPGKARVKAVPHADFQWGLDELRRFWCGARRFRWIRAMRITIKPDLTNFGDLL
jgi:hypothetical protein